jgi:type II secretory pathway predicted ATPase ExeA
MNNTLPYANKRRLQAHFGFTGLPFRKGIKAHNMFDSTAQRELSLALHLWTEVRGLALATGPAGVGKSITVRKFVSTLDTKRFLVFRFAQTPMTPSGFLRSFNRLLGLPVRSHSSDLFDQAREHLNRYEEANGTHPLLIFDDAEGMRADTLDLIRRLTNWELDAESRFSALFIGTEAIHQVLRDPLVRSLRGRFAYAAVLRPFSLEDTQNYLRFHLQKAGVQEPLFDEDSMRQIFLVSGGIPRNINQLATQALIQSVVEGRDAVDKSFLSRIISNNPLFSSSER